MKKIIKKKQAIPLREWIDIEDLLVPGGYVLISEEDCGSVKIYAWWPFYIPLKVWFWAKNVYFLSIDVLIRRIRRKLRAYFEPYPGYYEYKTIKKPRKQ